MGIADFAEEPLKFDIKEMLSKVISKMYSEKISEGFVFDRGQFVGIISAKDIARKGITEPEKVKLANLGGIIRNVKPFRGDAPIKEVVNSFLVNSYRCVPVERDGEILSLSKLGLMKLVSPEALKGRTVSDIMFFPECVSSYDNVSVAKSMFKNSSTYRLTVIGESNHVEGVIDDIDMLKSFVEKSRSSRGEKVGEKLKEGNVPIHSNIIVKDSYLSVAPNTELKYAVKTMIDRKQDTIVVEEDKKLLGVVTPREILKLVGNDIGGVYVTVSGIQNEDEFIQAVVDSEIRSSVRKLAKVVHIHYVTINVKKKVGGKSADYKIKTKRTNYTVIGRVVSNKGSFFADDLGWDLTKATRNVLKKLEKEIYKKVEKERAFERSPEGEYEEGS